jgi:hypothetical protein
MLHMTETDEQIIEEPIPRGRTAVSIIAGIGWLIFLIIWLFFYASNYTLLQNIAIFFVSVLVVGGINAIAWTPWGKKFEREGEERIEKPGLNWRSALSIITGVGWLIFLVIWLIIYASNYNLYQNVAIFLLSILSIALINGLAWSPWGMKHEFEGEEVPPGLGWRVALSIVTGIGWLVSLIVWFYFYAKNFNIYQNAAIFIVTLLIIGGLNTVLWVFWGIKYGPQYRK